MNQTQPGLGALIMPTLRYRDVQKAISWLCEAFGFEEHVAHRDDNGTIVHAELKRGHDMIMLSAARPDIFSKLQGTPADTGQVVTQSAYIVVDDVRALHDHVSALGGRIVFPFTEESYGQMFSCLDPEGHLWNFGNYNPWKV